MGPEWHTLLVIPSERRRSALSKALSLKLRDEVFHEAEEILRQSKRPRNAYFNEAINFYNRLWKRKLLKRTLARGEAALKEPSDILVDQVRAIDNCRFLKMTGKLSQRSLEKPMRNLRTLLS